MDNDLISKVAKSTGLDNKVANELSSALLTVLADNLSMQNNVAIPGFGTFMSKKTGEHIAVSATGNRSLVPPKITVVFRQGSRFRKIIQSR